MSHTAIFWTALFGSMAADARYHQSSGYWRVYYAVVSAVALGVAITHLVWSFFS